MFTKAVNDIKNLCRLGESVGIALFSSDHPALSNDIHIAEAMRWLLNAQKATSDDGISEAYHIYQGWLPSYPETTGYIVETFVDYFMRSKDRIYEEAALKMAKWLLSIQNSDGSISNESYNQKFVFDTGQVIFGFVRAFELTGKNEFKLGAISAGDWVSGLQEENGSWVRHAMNNCSHTYYSRVAWSLLRLHQITSNGEYLHQCEKNIDWCLTQQNESGWFRNASFGLKDHQKPYTHTIGYTIRGILEAGNYLKNETYIRAAAKAIDGLSKEIDSNGFVPGAFDQNWRGDHSFTCLTGNAQLAISIFKLSNIIKSYKYFQLGQRINRYLKTRQNLTTGNPGIRGAIAGSYPIWGRYMHFAYPNWATKFFADSLLLEELVDNQSWCKQGS